MSRSQIRERVRDAYSAVAANPSAPHVFAVGLDFAASLGYPEDLLRTLPAASLEAFTGVSNVSVFAEICPGTTVADIGCGAGLDSLAAARRTGRTGRVLGIDFSPEMLERARSAAAETRQENVVFCQADAERLPLATASVDVALVNGIFNLNPARAAIFQELGRIVRPGGAVFAAELILAHPLPPADVASESNWFA